MKRQFSLFIFSLLTLLACRSDDDVVQDIDQILNIYIKNDAGQDLLNTKLDAHYTNVALLDLLATTDQKPVSSNIIMDKDSVRYVEYVAGATRLIKDSINENSKSYYSSMIIRLTKIVDKAPVIDDDTIRIEYNWTPQKFEVSKMWHSNQLVFTKSDTQPNIVNIVK
ncbi:hypothetical protein G6R40_11465 [Chryseobacterium sp. POL2]|uniref:hypothetical protein n=1 Tax=Chryseobacterium sp. POL2 TaxID=2713414 RepID=UPI0013E14550|nr:hypothetical protein [Chryseobacterium sp. POL2]QIG90242.1 hypothetical protein G6R40_11465 [Chryseobacterium sp. POL2]